MSLPKAPTQMGEVLKGESNRKTQTRKKLKKESSDSSISSKQKKVDVNNLVSLAKKPVNKPKIPLAANKEKIGKSEGKKKLFVLDTNVLMHDPTSLFRFQEHDVYIPLVTLEELDLHKTGMSEVSRNVRQTTREIDSLIKTIAKTDPPKLNEGIPLNLNGHTDATGSLYFQTSPFDINKNFGFGDDKPDNQILSVVQHLKKKFKALEVILVSKDINIRIKANALMLLAEDYFNDSVIDDSDILYTGAIVLEKQFWEQIGDTLESWQQGGNVFYRFSKLPSLKMHLNQFIHCPDENLSAIVEEVTSDLVLLKTLKDFAHSKNSVWGITSRNPEQNFALNLLLNPEIDFVTLLGQAGTGKTLLTLAAGLAQTLETRTYSEIIITRATVPLGDDIGYLPGTEEEKMIPWMGAIEDNLEVLNRGVEGGGDWSRSAALDLMRSRIKIKSLSFMRGRTFLNKFLIIDEAQNLTPKEMKALITRAGPGTKVVCLGNVAQIDSPYLTESSSGLSYVVDKFKGWGHGGHITLQRGERSRLADFASETL